MKSRFIAAFAIALGCTMPAAAARAATGPKIAPNQAFVGLVNHSTGTPNRAAVKVACAGPVHNGETTHPLAHQPLMVRRAPASNTNAGSTGPDGTRITAYLGIPPAAGPSGTTSGSLPTFTHYGAPQPIPTSITVPCSGTGYITFMPWPRVPGQSRAFVVPIEYVNIAV